MNPFNMKYDEFEMIAKCFNKGSYKLSDYPIIGRGFKTIDNRHSEANIFMKVLYHDPCFHLFAPSLNARANLRSILG
ncbi:hypothetical protein KS4_33760 [Poriferisphaera corsica]|uniref:Uncharacterized protein n=1 Tax=Poriferisphaera corsica TaxID=2528020 RepID=A0A517YYI9_9BACT|nr:hypothetical protein KS4_33760 [Poriferisphaera corsica]